MIDPTQIKQKAQQQYSNFLSSIVTGSQFFPLEFSVGTFPKEYLTLRDAVTQLIDQSKNKLGYGYTVQLETRKTQKYGLQSLPKKIYFEIEKDYLKFIKKELEFNHFKENIYLIQTQIPQLQDWLCQNPKKVIEYAEHWDDLLKVCQYFQQSPKPNLYIRELPIPVHTKFIEQNQKIIRNLLEAILPIDQLTSVEGEKDYIFEKRFSLKYREPLIRLRFLDPSLKKKYQFPATDISIPVSEFKQLDLERHHCFITENLLNFLTLPLIEDSFAIFGSGYAIQTLKMVSWLSSYPIFYWGDLDVDGFRILSQLRSYFPQTISIMMDRETFEIFSEFAVSVARSTPEVLPCLTPEESTLYTYLATFQKRLEQEHIHQDYVNRFLQNLTIS